MFGYSHLPFSTSLTPLYNGNSEVFILYVDQARDLLFYLEQEPTITLYLEKFPQAIL